MNNKYQPHIDGLRGIAVLAVLLFHSGLVGVTGGFLGVDIFFVISGFLITRIIVSELDKGNFSLKDFYERRLRRIYPALAVVLLISAPAAWLILPPGQLVKFAQSLFSIIFLIPNIFFWRTTQYFGEAAELTPLLHTWSLGVEEQFYFFMPVLLVLLWRKGMRAIIWSIVALTVSSLILSEYAWRNGFFSSNFFLPLTRAWELGIGCSLALLLNLFPSKFHFSSKIGDGLAFSALAILVFSVLSFSSNSPSPGVLTLAPVLATAILISIPREGMFVYRLLSSKPLVAIGLISYSLYLWHQPVFAFMRQMLGINSPWAPFVGMVLSPILAWQTWLLVEKPTRARGVTSLEALLTMSFTSALLLIGFAAAVIGLNGADWRFDESQRDLLRQADRVTNIAYVEGRFSELNVPFSNTQTIKRILVIGDSHAKDLTNILHEAEIDPPLEVRTHYIPTACSIYFGPENVSDLVPQIQRPACRKYRGIESLAPALARADVVILVASWKPWAAERIDATIQSLMRATQSKILVAGPKWIGHVDPLQLGKIPLAARASFQFEAADHIHKIENILRKNTAVGVYISMQELVCGQPAGCPAFTENSTLISFDKDHLTRFGAQAAGKRLRALKAFDDALH